MASRRSTVDMSGVLKGLDKLIAAKEPIARAMGVAMGQEVRDEAKIRAPVLKPENVGLDNQRPYVLRDAIYVAYDKRGRVLNPSSFKYTVSWNSKKAPHGHLAEFGHWLTYEYALTDDGRYFTPKPLRPNDGFYVAAQPFLGPAFDAKVSGLNTIAAEAGAAKLKEVMA
jgi:hypothetical protein